MVEVVVLEGYLHKQSKHLKLWKIRYFVLAERALSYSKKSGKMAKNTYSLKDLDVIPDQNYVVHDHNFVFDVKYGDGEHMYLSAPTEAERLKWTQAIKATQGKLLHTDDGDGEKQLTDGRSSAASSTGVLGGVFQPPAATSRFQTTTSRYKRVATKERKDERKRARMPKMKKPFGAIWLDDVLPHWGDQAALVPPHLVEALCFAGIPKEIRGRAWSAMLGNRLQINEQLFDICRARAKAVLLEMDLVKEADEKSRQLVRLEHKLAPHQHVLEPQPQLHNERDHAHDDDAPPLLQLPAHLSIAGPPSRDSSTALDAQALADKLIADNERNIKLVQRDMPRTFGNHPLFQDGAAGAQKTYEVLEAYTCYRPDLGYVQGMSYLAAILCLHLDSFGAFRAMVSLMSTRLLFDMYRLEEERTLLYLSVYDSVLRHELPVLHAHFQEIGIDPRMYMVDWAFTLFTRCVPLEVVLRIWDCYMYLGTPFFFQACMGTRPILAHVPNESRGPSRRSV
ncbi:hypothetical protein, variant 1 [Aphanomyces invadans]|uniref:Rab-GAP TBC domain-containing protein n=1 Tax=Aphanomyces invadans TaxID=157072 RepID=A0A024UIX7_9STRA|nr:hypothetical protein, variant 1 [Aphanomyces invadans]ETW06249.1 hypothetical protein, variant 1 [Aphanomyces invadans]|eukprot:XP_008864324.1 hypothetical protein, variant 1 [Aphanomyces invadans]